MAHHEVVSSERGRLQRGLRPIALFALLFLVSSGGPYGMEEMVPSAGPGLAILVLIGMGLVWALPYALLVAELVSAIPEQGGLYRWYRAFLPPFWAFQFSCLDWLSWMMDAALYPTLLAAYLVRFLDPDAGRHVEGLVAVAFIWLCTAINIRGVALVGRLSLVLAGLALLPVVPMIVLGASQIGSAELRPFVADGTSPQAALHFALVFAVWSYSGYDALAYASEEVVEPERNYPRTLALLLPLVVAAYVLPLLVALAVTPDWASWETAHYNQVAFALGGTWLALLTVLAAQCSSAGLFYSELLVTSRLPYALARDGVLPAGFARLHPRYGTPWVFLVAQAVLYSALVSFLDFTRILVVSTWLSLPSYVLMFLAPALLRLRRPELRGRFRIPGGVPVLLLLAVAPIAIAVYVFVTVALEELLIGLAYLLVPPLLYLVARRARAASLE